ncbi:PaaX family transcriptional regulator C-terminal domain-containing protein [Paenibacillus massiliensis]|uniref:PaaX family transcriptional regulator C-terminal domain-containing protein n=1 Tax=Paenibacillus massiliensis TaxID=225917 RepID=UPI0003FCB221|nr:PaaX family transcriptional regulator C-terminal domain-containing protein [Paenibacillus massiliensis]
MLSIEKQILFLLTKKRCMHTKELVQIYTKRGYKEQSIRNVLSRMKKEKYIQAEERSLYSIVDKGEQFLSFVNRKPWQYDVDWNQKWCFVHFEVPEHERVKRDQFRLHLLQLGFGQLYKGVYVSPWDYSKQLLPWIHASSMNEYVTISEAAMLFGDITPERATKIWPLGDIHHLYQEKWHWYQAEFLPALNQEIRGGMDPLELFVLYLHIGEVISELSLRDPMLPIALLPEDWMGRRVIAELYRSFQSFATLIPSSSDYYQFLV